MSTTYTLPAEPDGPVWTNLNDSPLRWTLDGGEWVPDGGRVTRHTWSSLLTTYGGVSDRHPDLGFLPPTPWVADDQSVRDANGDQVLSVYTDNLSFEDDVKIAGYLVELVNREQSQSEGVTVPVPLSVGDQVKVVYDPTSIHSSTIRDQLRGKIGRIEDFEVGRVVVRFLGTSRAGGLYALAREDLLRVS